VRLGQKVSLQLTAKNAICSGACAGAHRKCYGRWGRQQALRKYQNRAIETAKVIEELIQLAKEMREAGARGEQLGLTEDEVAFYDALETNDSAVKVLGDENLRAIARELVATVRANVSIDWTVRENVRAHLRVLVKRILRKHGYPPDKAEKATQTVLEQAEVLSEGWAVA
jgi:type I restriction enzyme R subunit